MGKISKNDKGMENILGQLNPPPTNPDIVYIYQLLEGYAVTINKLIDEVLLIKKCNKQNQS